MKSPSAGKGESFLGTKETLQEKKSYLIQWIKISIVELLLGEQW